MAGVGEARSGATLGRVAALAAVVLWTSAGHALFPGAARREELQYLLVLPLGYGHLLGALVFSRERLARFAPRGARGLFAAFVATSVLSAFAAYAWALDAFGPVFLLPLLAVFTWHTLENELALGRAYRDGLRIGPLPRHPEPHLLAVGGTALLLLAAVTAEGGRAYAESFFSGAHALGIAALRTACVATGAVLWLRQPGARRGGIGVALVVAGLFFENRWLTLGDVVAAATLYHLVSWLLFFGERVRALRRESPGAARRLAGRLAWVHALPLAVCLGVVASSADWLAPLRAAVVAPSIYLFWSACHVFQTTAARGLEPRAA